MTYNTVYVRKELKRYPYKIQLMNGLKLEDRPAEEQFARIMIPHLDQSDRYLNEICVSGKPTFHTSGMVNRHNAQIQGRENSKMVPQCTGLSQLES